MSQIILDVSANTHLNRVGYIKRMLDELKAVDTGKHEIVIKHQLFVKAGDNVPLDREVFAYAYGYAADLGYQTTSSVFDKESLDFLLQFDVPFVKIANQRGKDWLIGFIPRGVPVYVSYGDIDEWITARFRQDITCLLCVSNYPATIEEYEEKFKNVLRYSKVDGEGISDHTTNWGLWYRYQPKIIEVHYKLPDSTGLDAGPFARTPQQLAEVL